ncbi:hypothetical protein [Tabrizicola sp.]
MMPEDHPCNSTGGRYTKHFGGFPRSAQAECAETGTWQNDGSGTVLQ